jgi:predicted TIM-barrel fold metal-dependent hydrolase
MSNSIIDFHAHAFPDALAARAISQLEHGGGVKAFLDGRVSSLLGSMDSAGIGTSVICSIATKPEQFDPILRWSRQIASERIVPLPSIHPKGPDPIGQARRVAEAGLVGIKLHPYYQDFDLDDESLLPLYRVIEQLGLLLVCHTGFDFAFPRDRRADPARVRRVVERVPGLKLVATHMGAWDDWDEVERHLIGLPISMDISLSLDLLGPGRARDMILAHPMDRVLFGTDSPWGSQAATMAALRALGLGEARDNAILWGNAQALLARSGRVQTRIVRKDAS